MVKGRTFRIFVSSTFSDLKAERNALAKWVFPKLRVMCEKRGYKLQIVDLRWGVSEEASVDQQTVRICLDEIARCQRLSPRPNFIVLLGDRYGWRPPPSVVPRAEMAELTGLLSEDERRLILYREGEPDDEQNGWYRLDENADPPEYVLLPRSRGKKQFEVHDAWVRVEQRLHDALSRTAKEAGFPEGKREKYLASATELEIIDGALNKVLVGARQVSEAGKHVFAFYRTITNRDDVRRALAKGDKAAMGLLDAGREDENGGPWDLLRRLKARLRSKLGDNVRERPAIWTGSGITMDHIGAPTEGTDGGTPAKPEFPDGLCKAVWDHLSKVIDEEIEQEEKDFGGLEGDARGRARSEKQLAEERQAHRDFGEERARVFVGRGDLLKRIDEYLSSGTAGPLVIHGQSGCGKSALMARAVARVLPAIPDTGDASGAGGGNAGKDGISRAAGAVILERYVGTSPGSSEIRPLLDGVCREIARAYGVETDEPVLSGDYPKLVAAFEKYLKVATPERPLWLFLDALDQLGDGDQGRNLVWLPPDLPPNVRIVVSTLEDEKYECFEALQARGASLVPLGGLNKEEGKQTLNEWFAGKADAREDSTGKRREIRRRKLTSEKKGGDGRPSERGQMEILLDKFEKSDGSPLYLKLAYEEARRWHSYDGDAPAAALPVGARAMIAGLFDRLEGHHRKLIVDRALGYLTAARYGLSDEEMLDLLWRDDEAREDFLARARHELPEGAEALPPIVWSRLYFDLEPYLAPRVVFGARLLSWFHRQFGEVAAERYLKGSPTVSTSDDRGQLRSPPTRAHSRIADYFGKRWQAPDTHALLELVGHLVRSGKQAEAKHVLLQFEWLAKKLAATNVHLLLADYEELPLDRQEPAGLVSGAIRLSNHVLAERPAELASQLLGRLLGFDEKDIRLLTEQARGSVKPPALVPVSRQLESPGGPLIRTIVLDQGIVFAVALSADGRIAASGSAQGTVGIWDLATGKARYLLAGHQARVVAMALDEGGQVALSASADETMKVWNAATGQVTLSIAHRATSVSLSADGRLAVCNAPESRRNTRPLLWDLSVGSLISDFDPWHPPGFPLGGRPRDVLHSREPHAEAISAVAISGNGRFIATGSTDRTIKIWDVVEQRLIRTLVGHRGAVHALALSHDGRIAVSGASEGLTRIWDVERGTELPGLPGSAPHVVSVAVSADGRVVVAGSWDDKITAWMREGGGPSMPPLEGHDDKITSVAVTAGGDVAVSGSRDGTVKVWSLGGHSSRRTSGLGAGKSEVTKGPILSVAVSAGGRLAASTRQGATALSIWDVDSGLIHRAIEAGDGTHGIALDHEDRVVVVGVGRRLLAWNLESERKLFERDASAWRVEAVSVSRSRRVATSFGGKPKIWDLDTGRLERHTDASGSPKNDGGVAISANGRFVVTTWDRLLKVWDVESKVAGKQMGDVAGLADVCEKVQTLVGHNETVRAVAISNDGDLVVSGGDDRTVRVWSVGSGRLIRTLEGHGGPVVAVAMGEDCKIAASASHDRTVRIWDISTGDLISSFTADAVLTSMALASHRRRLVVGDALGRVHFLELLLPALRTL